MFKRLTMTKWISTSGLIFTLGFASLSSLAKAGLPDFTELAEKQGPTVVNVSITSTVHGNSGAMPFPGMDEEDIPEFFKRFGIPGIPGMPGQPGQGGYLWLKAQ